MRKIILLMFITVISFLLTSCTSKKIQNDVNPEKIVGIYKGSIYSTWIEFIELEKLNIYKYHTQIKVFDPNNESDYIFIYFFSNIEEANSYEKENQTKGDFFWIFSSMLGESTKVKYKSYENILIESYQNTSNKKQNQMIEIFENYIYKK